MTNSSQAIRSDAHILGVLFDVDGTLYHEGVLRLIICAHILFFLLVRPLRTLRDMRIIMHYRRAQEYLRSTCSSMAIAPDSQARRAAETSNIGIEEISARVHLWMEKLPLRFMPIAARRYLIKFIQRWHKLGVPMSSYSDYPAEAKLKYLGLGSLFESNLCSTDADIGTFKPMPNGFIVAARRLGLPPQNIMYIGNREDVDVVGAKSAGMCCIIIKRKLKSLPSQGHPKIRLRCLDASLRRQYADPNLPSCWVCGSKMNHVLRPSTIRRTISPACVRITDKGYGETGALRRCRCCGFTFVDPLPSPELVKLYREMDDPAYEATASARSIQMRQLLELALRFHPRAATLLDVGAGTGLLVSEATKRGLKAEGVEPSKWCVEVAQRARRMNLLCGTLDEYADNLGQYDLVMLVDVVEHVSDPISLLRQASRRLAPKGRLVVVTPDIGSLFARLLRKRWWHCRVAHVGYFDRASMGYAFQQCGLGAVADIAVGWRFPLTYLLERLEYYVPVPFLKGLLRRASGSRWSRREINLKLYDSRMFIAKKEGDE